MLRSLGHHALIYFEQNDRLRGRKADDIHSSLAGHHIVRRVNTTNNQSKSRHCVGYTSLLAEAAARHMTSIKHRLPDPDNACDSTVLEILTLLHPISLLPSSVTQLAQDIHFLFQALRLATGNETYKGISRQWDPVGMDHELIVHGMVSSGIPFVFR